MLPCTQKNAQKSLLRRYLETISGSVCWGTSVPTSVQAFNHHLVTRVGPGTYSAAQQTYSTFSSKWSGTTLYGNFFYCRYRNKCQVIYWTFLFVLIFSSQERQLRAHARASVHAQSAPMRRNAGLRHVSWAEWNSPSDAVRKLNNKQDSKKMSLGRSSSWISQSNAGFRFSSQLGAACGELPTEKKTFCILHWMV